MFGESLVLFFFFFFKKKHFKKECDQMSYCANATAREKTGREKKKKTKVYAFQ